MEVIERNARAQAKLIEDLLDVSRVTTGKLRLATKPLNLSSVVCSGRSGASSNSKSTVRSPSESRSGSSRMSTSTRVCCARCALVSHPLYRQ